MQKETIFSTFEISEKPTNHRLKNLTNYVFSLYSKMRSLPHIVVQYFLYHALKNPVRYSFCSEKIKFN